MNLIAWRTWAWQVVDTIKEGSLNLDFSHSLLVWYDFWKNENDVTSLYKTKKTRLYKNLRYKWAVGLNFLFDRITPWAINIKYLYDFPKYKEADIVHLHSIQWWYFDRKDLETISKEKNVIMTLHDDRIISGNDYKNIFFKYKTKRSYIKRKKILENCNITYIWVSNRITNKLKKDSIVKDNTVKTIYNWINTNIFNKNSKEKCRIDLWLPSDKIIMISIAWSGNKSKSKWLEYVQKIIKKYNKNQKYLFITIWNHSTKKISNNFWELWWVDHEKMAKYFNAADVFLYPTLADNCPLTVLESIACWLPVLSFNTWGIEEIIKHKKNWYISPYKDYDSLIKWFERILENKDKLDVSLDSKFTQEAMVDQYIDLYKTLVQNK